MLHLAISSAWILSWASLNVRLLASFVQAVARALGALVLLPKLVLVAQFFLAMSLNVDIRQLYP